MISHREAKYRENSDRFDALCNVGKVIVWFLFALGIILIVNGSEYFGYLLFGGYWGSIWFAGTWHLGYRMGAMTTLQFWRMILIPPIGCAFQLWWYFGGGGTFAEANWPTGIWLTTGFLMWVFPFALVIFPGMRRPPQEVYRPVMRPVAAKPTIARPATVNVLIEETHIHTHALPTRSKGVKDALALLELQDGYTDRQLADRRRAMLKLAHPDVGGSKAMVRMIENAYALLKARPRAIADQR